MGDDDEYAGARDILARMVAKKAALDAIKPYERPQPPGTIRLYRVAARCTLCADHCDDPECDVHGKPDPFDHSWHKTEVDALHHHRSGDRAELPHRMHDDFRLTREGDVLRVEASTGEVREFWIEFDEEDPHEHCFDGDGGRWLEIWRTEVHE